MTDRISRRRFLEETLALLGGAAVAPVAWGAAQRSGRPRAVSPNEKIHVACIGVHGRGMDHVKAYLGTQDAVIVAICDVDTEASARAAAAVVKGGAPAPKTVQDIRTLLDDPSIDVVSIATPNHWHSLAAIWAMQAGKDVYVEKPVSHNVREGRHAVQAARKYGRICQAGTQIRSSRGVREAMDYLHSGQLGKIHLARALCYKRRQSIGHTVGDQPIPSTVDYGLWIGPAPMKPLHRKSLHYDWHWQWDYGNGDLGNQGIHQMDVARWGLNAHAFPSHVLGGRFGYEDDGETPNTELAFFDYGHAHLIFEVRGLETPDLQGVKIGNLFYGEKGVMVVPSYSDAVVYDNDGHKIQEFHGDGDHFRNFLDAVRSRKRADQTSDIEEGHLSSALCHLANISYRLGTLQPFDPATRAFGEDKEAYATFARFEEHLTANGLHLQQTSYRLGRSLTPDAHHETFGADREANALLTRDYRAPFVVPDKV